MIIELALVSFMLVEVDQEGEEPGVMVVAAMVVMVAPKAALMGQLTQEAVVAAQTMDQEAAMVATVGQALLLLDGRIPNGLLIMT
jgi:hypothetical protein